MTLISNVILNKQWENCHNLWVCVFDAVFSSFWDRLTEWRTYRPSNLKICVATDKMRCAALGLYQGLNNAVRYAPLSYFHYYRCPVCLMKSSWRLYLAATENIALHFCLGYCRCCAVWSICLVNILYESSFVHSWMYVLKIEVMCK